MGSLGDGVSSDVLSMFLTVLMVVITLMAAPRGVHNHGGSE